MNNQDVLLLTLVKKTEAQPWSLTMEAPSGLIIETTIGPGGRTPAGPLFSELLIELDGTIQSYPYRYDMRRLAEKNKRSARVRFLNNRPTYIDILLETKRHLFQHKQASVILPQEELVSIYSEANYFTQKNQKNARMQMLAATQPVEVRNEHAEYENKFWLFFDSENIEVINGDTFKGYIIGYSWPNGLNVPDKIGNQPITTNDKSALVSYLGVEAFYPANQKGKDNTVKAKYYGLTKKILDSAGEEAKVYNYSLIHSKKIVAVSLQYDSSTNQLLSDDNKNISGVVYATDYTSFESAKSAAQNGQFKGININKEMLKPMYSDYQSVQSKNPGSALLPLAEYNGFTKVNSKAGIKTANWGYELNLTAPPNQNSQLAAVKNDGKFKGADEKIQQAVKEAVSDYKKKGNTRQDVSIKGYINNDLSFVKPYDDRLMKGHIYKPTSDMKNELVWDYRNKVRIGDVFVPIPPLSIRVDKQFQNEKVTTMRAKSSLQKQVGSVRNILSMDLYYHDLESINGTKTKGYTTPEGEEVVYYMDGLRSLLAQFKKAPFLPIDNEYINASLGIQNVSLRSITASTVSGFPEALKVTLIVEEFDTAPFLMGVENLGDKINYPLLRWHYQKMLSEPVVYEPWRTYLPEINRLDNAFTFSIIDEDQLIERKNALHKFREMKTPYEYEKDETDLDTTAGQKSTDGKNIKNMLNAYTTFLNEYKSRGLKKNYQKAYTTPLVIGDGLGWDTFNNSFTGDISDSLIRGELANLLPSEQKLGKDLAVKLYGEGPNKDGFSKPMPLYNMGAFSDITKSPATAAFYTFRTISSGKGFAALGLSNSTMKEIRDNNLPGYFQVYLENDEHKKMFKDKQVKGIHNAGNKNGGGSSKSSLFLIPAGDVSKEKNYLTKLKQIAKIGDSLNEKIENYNYEYNALSAQINQTEENMAMNDVFIPDLIPLDLSVAMENTFSEAQVQAAETPTMQFFGSGDPQLQLTFETTASGVEATEKMFRTVGGYIKNYREGIVSGFMGIDNPLVNLFGIRTVLPEAVQYNTVAGFPDRKLITITFSAFDKTQRRQEALYGYTAGDTSETLRDRAYDNYDPRVDSLYMHERMRQMELYPDLEMGKVSELNSILPKIDAKMEKWENRTGQVFLDPDFYISTSATYRNFIKDILDDDNSITFRFEDAAGYTADSNLSEANPLKMNAEDTARYEKEAEETEYIDPTLKWKEYDEEAEENKPEDENETLKMPKTIKVKPASYSNSRVKDYISSGDYKKVPSYATWNGWNGGKKTTKQYESWKKSLSKPLDDGKVWFYLADCIMSSFSNNRLAYAKGEKAVLVNKARHTEVDKLVNYYETDKFLGKLTWASAIDYFKIVYTKVDNKVIQSINSVVQGKKEMKHGAYSKDPDNANILSKAVKGFAETADFLFGAGDELAALDGIPFQRIMSYFKAIITTESNWNQFEGGQPKLYDKNTKDKLATKAGIMGARLTTASSKEEAERMIWDWKYNIKKSVSQMSKVFTQGEKSKYKELFARRLDWAVVSHSGAKMPAILASNSESDDKANGFEGGLISPDASAYFLAVMQKRQQDCLLATDDNAPGIYLNGSNQLIRPVFNLYNDFSMDDSLESMKTTFEGDKKSESKLKEAYEKAYAKEVQQISNNMENWTTEEKLKGMFVDMYQHDQTGRMLRAFPSFSLQIIDEGKWYNNFRTWDNFYGYNALHKIDVYKSRKIAADTAVIEMSNMYGGLTSKRKDMEYTDLNLPGFFSSAFWQQDVFGEPTEELLKERKEIFKTMFLEPGARVTLRMGYGSDARYLPETFNGVITEVSAGDVVTITAQGDGLELTNVISGSENDKNKEFMKVIEPSDYIGKLLTSKGNWMKDLINDGTDGKFFRENPLGIAHFGSTIESSSGTWNPFSGEYGEAVQNVYSQNGQFAKEQWMKPDGSKVGMIQGLFGGLLDGSPLDLGSLTSPNDEDNILVKLYGNTPWDIIQTFALCSMDYVGAVFPMETRSSLFFGKPIWPVTYKYDSQYSYDETARKWRRELLSEHKKTFMQAHVYSSQFNILSNDMRASEEGVYNNVIVSYDGKMAGPLQADNDIRLDRQRTTMVEANLVAKWGADGNIAQFFGANYWTTESQALKYGMSTVRDNMKDMYKGSYIVLGDPTVKPHDTCFINDTTLDIQGIHMVKAVHHSMSLESGFITHIEPDAYVVNFDAEMLFLADKIFAVGKTTAMRATASALSFASSYLFSGSVLSKMFKGLGSLVRLTNIQDKVIPYTSGIVNRVQSNFAKEMGRRGGSQTIINLGEQLKNVELTDLGVETVTKELRAQINQVKMLKTDMKMKKKALKSLNGQQAAKNSFNLYKNALDIDDLKSWSELNTAYAEFDAAVSTYNASKKSGRAATVASATTKVAKTLDTSVRKGGQIAKTIVTSAAFWTIVADVALEVMTSGLIEMWSRRKQNAECVKVIPLTYKGSSWTAGMNGHRGGVWGDDPSLADRLYNAEFGGGDSEIDDVWWSFFPKLFNSLEVKR